MKITVVACTRPNVIKIALIIKEIRFRQKQSENIEYRLIHTVQHYYKKMSGDLFVELGNLKRRIESHICISFVACKICMELE